MADDSKVVINLTTGHENADKLTVAFLVVTAAQTRRGIRFVHDHGTHGSRPVSRGK